MNEQWFSFYQSVIKKIKKIKKLYLKCIYLILFKIGLFSLF